VWYFAEMFTSAVLFQVLNNIPEESVKAIMTEQRKVWGLRRPLDVATRVLELPHAFVREWLQMFTDGDIDLRNCWLPLHSILTLISLLPSHPAIRSLHLCCRSVSRSSLNQESLLERCKMDNQRFPVEDACILRALNSDSVHLAHLQVLGLHGMCLQKLTVSCFRGLCGVLQERLTGLAVTLICTKAALQSSQMKQAREAFFIAVARLRKLRVLALPQWKLLVGDTTGVVAPLRGLGGLTVQICEQVDATHVAEVSAFAPALRFSVVSALRFPI
jgi:hypothetical protein